VVVLVLFALCYSATNRRAHHESDEGDAMRFTRLILLLAIALFFGAQSAQPQEGIPAIAKAANGAVVSIVMSDKDGRPLAQGSGFLVSKDGLIVTNYHVIAEGSSAVLKLPEGAFYVVDGVLAFDKARDVAVIKAHGTNFRTLTLGNSDRVQVGQEVVAIGNPLSLESTVSNGIVSGIRTVGELGGKFLQITTPISPGSSGGPLFNMAGEVVGITTLYLKGGENLNFAIPINDVKRLLLANSTKLQDLPNETEPVKAQTHNGNPSFPPDYVCLDTVVKAVAPDGGTVFTSLEVKRGECESAVMPSPLSEEDRDLLYKMSIDASNVSELHLADEMREAGGEKRTWAPLIEMGVRNFRRMRTQLCSKHPDMFVYQLEDDGERAAPKSCAKE
jgi:S1-C subfamily serine protease